jgi:hypothetical protein
MAYVPGSRSTNPLATELIVWHTSLATSSAAAILDPRHDELVDQVWMRAAVPTRPAILSSWEGVGERGWEGRGTKAAGRRYRPTLLAESGGRGRKRGDSHAARDGLQKRWPKKNLKDRGDFSKLHVMTLPRTTPSNERRIFQLKADLAEVLEVALRRGFYGKVGVDLKIQDGTIQQVRKKILQVQQ